MGIYNMAEIEKEVTREFIIRWKHLILIHDIQCSVVLRSLGILRICWAVGPYLSLVPSK